VSSFLLLPLHITLHISQMPTKVGSKHALVNNVLLCMIPWFDMQRLNGQTATGVLQTVANKT